MARRLRPLPAGIALLALAAALLPGAVDAASRPCGDRVLDDWYDGRIDAVYPPECYAAALAALPEDVRAYSTAEEDINQALRQRLTGLARAESEDESPAPEQPQQQQPQPSAAPPAAEPEQPDRQQPSRALSGRGTPDAAPADDEVVAAPAVEQPPEPPDEGAPAWAPWAAALAALVVVAALPLGLRRWRRAGA
ncbi:MAG TPA: hypothetical protein VK874_04540 [Gaiellaceae bacterium]|nr:hypothetical protein [Gaiellaceae bacterium]